MIDKRFEVRRASRHAQYWIPRQRHQVHLVRAVSIHFEGVDATWDRPRLTVDLWCRSLHPARKWSLGLSRTPQDINRVCERCVRRLEAA